MSWRPALCSLLLAASQGVAAADPWNADTLRTAEAIRDRGLHDDDAYAVIESVSREVGPRPAGSANDPKAVAWALRTLTALGFSNVHAEPVTVPHWERGTLSVRIVGDHEDLAATALGGSVGTPAKGITADVVMTENIESLRQLKAEAVSGRIVYFDQHMERAKDGSGYGKAVRVRILGAAEAARRGAVGIAIRSISTAADHNPHTGAMRYDEIVKKIPAVALGPLDADLLSQRVAAGGKVQLRMAVGARDLGKAKSANVIGDIPGETNDIVLLGAHLDSWDLARGSNDDGAGIGIVTTAAHLVQQVAGKPHRTLRVVLFASEEVGIVGAKAYAADHAAEMDRHVVAMEADFGSAAVWRLGADVPEAQWPVVQAIVAVLAPLGVEEGSNGSDGGADVSPQRALGVPIFAPLQDGTLYFDTHHSPADTLDHVDRDGLRQNVAVYATAAYLASEFAPGLGRVPLAPQ